MTNKEVVARLAGKFDLSKAEAKRTLDSALDSMSDTLSDGKGFSIPELGTFKTIEKEARKAYNPHYKQYMQIPKKRVVEFSPSSGLKEEMKDVEPDHE